MGNKECGCEENKSNTQMTEILELISKLIDPMTQALEEIKRSVFSRYMVLIIMGVMTLGVCGAMGFVLVQMQGVVEKMNEVSAQLALNQLHSGLTELQVDKLVKLAEETASSEPIRKKLKSILQIKSRSSGMLRDVIKEISQNGDLTKKMIQVSESSD